MFVNTASTIPCVLFEAYIFPYGIVVNDKIPGKSQKALFIKNGLKTM